MIEPQQTSTPATSAPDDRAVASSRVEISDRSAGIVSRGLAGVIDVVVVLAVNACLYLGLLLARLTYAVHDFSLPEINPFFSAGAFVLVSLIYLTVCWSTTGRTVGAGVMGLRVLSRKGAPRVRVAVAALRALICVFLSLGLLWVAVDRRRRSLADLLLRTRVVYSR